MEKATFINDFSGFDDFSPHLGHLTCALLSINNSTKDVTSESFMKLCGHKMIQQSSFSGNQKVS
jgi:hypothetical protein